MEYFSGKKQPIIYRVIAAVALSILISAIFRIIYTTGLFDSNNNLNCESVCVLILDTISMIPCIVICIKPSFFGLASISALIYSFFLSLSADNMMGLFMFYVQDKILNLALFTGMQERDAKTLNELKTGNKYSIIARNTGYTEGSLKNRLHIIFDVLGISNRKEFIEKYGDCHIVYDEDIS